MATLFHFLLLSIILFPPSTNARTLFWDEINVTANLDQEGRLHVSEIQSIIFSGDWNGGERNFLVRSGQEFDFDGLSRLAGDGDKVPLTKGNLNLVDHWDYNGKNAIRWRSRLPSDPPFMNTAISYELRYTFNHILTAKEDTYLLNHDFCFPDRSGVVKNFRLYMTFDPVWNSSPATLVRENIPPGQSVVLQQELAFSGQGNPAVYYDKWNPLNRPPASSAPGWLGGLLFVILVTVTLWRVYLFFQWEKALNRFAPIPSTEKIDDLWLEKELFVHKPEVVGATWDKTTSTAEVAAVLARLVQEEKMKSWMEPYVLPFFNIRIPGIPPVLHLRLLKKYSAFTGYELKLIKGLFVDGSMETDSKTLRQYYRKKRKTFDPVSKIRKPLKREMKKLIGDGKSPLQRQWLPTLLLTTLGFFLLLINAFLHQDEFLSLELYAVTGISFCWLGGIIHGFIYRESVVSLKWRLAAVFLPLSCVIFAFGLLLLLQASSLLIIGVFCLAAAINKSIMNFARSKESGEGLALRRKLAASRNYFQKELKQEEPQVEDSWYPYLLAFGLGPEVDSWFNKYGSFVNSSRSTTSTFQGHSGPRFTGGGGAFGGGGASSSWHTAVGSLAASASSSSGGGSSSGSSSSGGGGGGGW